MSEATKSTGTTRGPALKFQPSYIQRPLQGSMDGQPFSAWAKANVEGSIMVKIGCQEHSFGKWQKDGFDIIRRHVYGGGFTPSSDELVGALIGDRKNALEKLAARFEAYVKQNKGAIDDITHKYSVLQVTLDLIEKALAPSVALVKKKVAAKKKTDE